MAESGKEVQPYGGDVQSMLKDESGNQQCGFVIDDGNIQAKGIREENSKIVGACSYGGAKITAEASSKRTVVGYESLDGIVRPVTLVAGGKAAAASLQATNASNLKARIDIKEEGCEIM